MPTKQQPQKQLSAEQIEARRARRKAARQRRAAARKVQAVVQPRNQVVSKAMQVVKRNVDTRGGRMVTKMMMLPGECTAVRVPTVDMPKTAIVQTRQIRNFDEFGEDPGFGNNTYVAIVYGEPSLTHMDGPYKYPSDGNASLSFINIAPYGGSVQVASPSWDMAIPGGGAGTVNVYNLEDWWNLAKITNNSTILQPRRPIMNVDGVTYTFLNRTEELVVTGGVVTGGGQGNVTLGVYAIQDANASPVFCVSKTITWTGGIPIAATLVSLEAGWYAVKAEEFSVTSGLVTDIKLTMEIRWYANRTYYKLNYIPEIGSTPTIANDCRRTALSLLVSNRSNQFTAQGNVVAARMETCFPGTPKGEEMWTALPSAQHAYSGNAQKGCYTYCEFDNFDELFRDYVNDWGNPICYWGQGMMNVIAINNHGAQNNTYTVVCDSVLEFKSQSQLFPAGVPLLEHEELIEARRINNMTTYFYENPLHWSDISRYVEKMWKWTRSHSTGIGSALSMVFPEASPLIMPAARFLQT